MTYAEAILSRAVMDGILAQRKLNGDASISGPDDHDQLQALISQGKQAEGQLRASSTRDGLALLKRAYENEKEPYVE